MSNIGSHKKPLFRKVLIANRGEIAVRIIQTLQEMGIRAVALYSDIDKSARHVTLADEAYHLPGVSPAETYLQGDKIIEIAKAHGVEAVHPGYGFLSENANFSRRCNEAGITFIGPTPEVIHSMGDKIISKMTMQKAGVPVVPGWSGEPDTPMHVLQSEADKIGYPILVKAAAGGGGKGMRLVHQPDQLADAVESAAREAQKAFGDARVFLEKYITRPRHIEFQVFGEMVNGRHRAVHLFERECSIQRRHQKIVEETPSPRLSQDLRLNMGDAAVKAAQAIGYTNAGTVEFIMDDRTGAFYFLEMNTRLQVEHPVTELTVHHDLVRAQLEVAAGHPMPFEQNTLKQDGHAIECRIYAEDPNQNFLPSTGTLSVYRPPEGPGIRVDSGFQEGDDVTVHYDPMLSKLAVWGKTRQEAIEKMIWALKHYAVLGVTTNIEFLQDLLKHPEFQAGNLHTHFLEEHAIGGKTPPPGEALMLAALVTKLAPTGGARAAAGGGRNGNGSGISSGIPDAEANNPWHLAGAWQAF